jgi:hypothetical protein
MSVGNDGHLWYHDNKTATTQEVRVKGIDWYEKQLEREDLDPTVRDEYEREADRLADGISSRQVALKTEKQKAAARAAAIKALLESGDTNVVDLYGIEEFGRDYNTDVSEDGNGYKTWHVTSTVARADQPNSWSFDDEEGARRYLHGLIYDRMYYKYVRLGKVDNLQELPSRPGTTIGAF